MRIAVMMQLPVETEKRDPPTAVGEESGGPREKKTKKNYEKTKGGGGVEAARKNLNRTDSCLTTAQLCTLLNLFDD